MKNFDIKISNLGKVESADIRIRPFTVIAGKNSSGKSYVTKSLYSIFHQFNKDLWYTEMHNLCTRLKRAYKLIALNISYFSNQDEIFIEESTEIVDKMITIISTTQKSPLKVLEINDSLVKIRENHQELSDCSAAYFNLIGKKTNKLKSIKQIKTVLEGYLKEIATNIKSYEEAYATLLEKNITKSLIDNFQISSLKQLINHNSGEDSHTTFNFSELGELEIINSPTNSMRFLFQTKELDYFESLDNVIYIESPMYLKLTHALQNYRKLPPAYKRDLAEYETTLSGVPGFFYTLIDLLNTNRVSSPENEQINGALRELEEAINGELKINQYGDIFFHEKSNPDIAINLNATASGIANLGILGLLIKKNLITPNTFLFMDEPEVNLHPEWQILMLKTLYAISKTGVNVVITTHSMDMINMIEYIMTEHDDDAYPDHFGINYLQSNGYTLADSDRGLKEIRFIKKDLGMPYQNIFIEKITKKVKKNVEK